LKAVTLQAWLFFIKTLERNWKHIRELK